MKRLLHGIYKLLGGFAAVCCFACTTDVDLEALRKPPKLVLNSRLAAGDTVSARVTRTWFYTDHQPDILLPGAEVGLYVNGQWKGRMTWQPADLRYDREGCFLSSYRAAPGDRLRIEVSHPGYEKTWAEATVPAAAPLVDIQLSRHTFSYPQQTQVRTDYDVTLRDDPAGKNYYLLELQEGYLLDSVSPSGPTYSWTPLSLDFSRDPAFDDQTTALDKFFGHDGSSSSLGQVFTDALFDGKEYVLKMSSTYYIYHPAGQGDGYENGYGSRLVGVEREGYGREEIPGRLLRFRLYTLTESYYLYLRSLAALEGSTFEGDMAELGLTSPIRVYSNIEGGGTGIVAAYAADTWIISRFPEADASSPR